MFYANDKTSIELEKAHQSMASSAKIQLNSFSNWDDFLIFTSELKNNDLFVIITSRTEHISFSYQLEKLPYYLSNYFKNNSFIILYPQQLDQGISMEDLQQAEHSLLDTFAGRDALGKVGSSLKRIFKIK